MGTRVTRPSEIDAKSFQCDAVARDGMFYSAKRCEPRKVQDQVASRPRQFRGQIFEPEQPTSVGSDHSCWNMSGLIPLADCYLGWHQFPRSEIPTNARSRRRQAAGGPGNVRFARRRRPTKRRAVAASRLPRLGNSSTRFSRKATQSFLTGQIRHCGLRGVQTSAPSSMSDWFKAEQFPVSVAADVRRL